MSKSNVNRFKVYLFLFLIVSVLISASFKMTYDYLNRKTLPCFTYANGSIHGLSNGAKIRYHGFEMGTVKKISIERIGSSSLSKPEQETLFQCLNGEIRIDIELDQNKIGEAFGISENTQDKNFSLQDEFKKRGLAMQVSVENMMANSKNISITEISDKKTYANAEKDDKEETVVIDGKSEKVKSLQKINYESDSFKSVYTRKVMSSKPDFIPSMPTIDVNEILKLTTEQIEYFSEEAGKNRKLFKEYMEEFDKTFKNINSEAKKMSACAENIKEQTKEFGIEILNTAKLTEGTLATFGNSHDIISKQAGTWTELGNNAMLRIEEASDKSGYFLNSMQKTNEELNRAIKVFKSLCEETNDRPHRLIWGDRPGTAIPDDE